jgi:hypothetical protein
MSNNKDLNLFHTDTNLVVKSLNETVAPKTISIEKQQFEESSVPDTKNVELINIVEELKVFSSKLEKNNISLIENISFQISLLKTQLERLKIVYQKAVDEDNTKISQSLSPLISFLDPKLKELETTYQRVVENNIKIHKSVNNM